MLIGKLFFLSITGFKVQQAIRKQNAGDISVPVARSKEKLKRSIKQYIENGTYNIGVPVVETQISKLSINKEGNVEQTKCNLQARKIPLEDIRKKALVTNKDLLQINSDLFYDNLSGNEIKVAGYSFLVYRC